MSFFRQFVPLSDTNKYRPIAIFPVVSKIIDEAVHKHVYSYVSKHNLLSKHQSGFRPFHSIETCLIDMVNQWVCNMNSGSMTGVVLIDLSIKAFDTVNHDILLTKLLVIGVSEQMLKWFKSYLCGRFQKYLLKTVYQTHTKFQYVCLMAVFSVHHYLSFLLTVCLKLSHMVKYQCMLMTLHFLLLVPMHGKYLTS